MEGPNCPLGVILFDPSKQRVPMRWFVTCLSLFVWHVRLCLDEPIEDSDKDERKHQEK